MKILVVEDNKTIQANLKEILTDLGHEVVRADCGAVGLMLLVEDHFDALLLDLVMPVVDGFTFLREAVRLPKKVIVTTALLPSEMMEIKRYPCATVLQKPYSVDELKVALEELP